MPIFSEPIEKRECLFFWRLVVQPIQQHAEVVDPEQLRRPPAGRRNLAATNGLVDQV